MDKLDLIMRQEAHAIACVFEDDIGLIVGSDTRTASKSDAEVKAVHQAVMAYVNTLELENDWFEDRNSGAICFWSLKNAKKALKIARAAQKNVERPLPKWAIKATAEGWRPPRGWKP